MPTKVEKDAVTGQETTGHEWDGIKELNTPLPKWWLYTFIATCVWALVWVVLYPSVPGITGYFHGILGYSTRAGVTAEVQAQAAQRNVVMDRIRTKPTAAVRDDPELLAMAMNVGRITFANNCQPCHGQGGGGQIGYPALAGDAWIWGGKLADIEHTITVGVRSAHPDARATAMPRFGADGLLKPEEIQAVADYVMTLYGASPAAPVAAPAAARGRALFTDNCAACHGENGEGKRDMGAPALRAAVHLYGSDRATVVAQITAPRLGVMPNWNARLDEATIRSVALYVHALGGGE